MQQKEEIKNQHENCTSTDSKVALLKFCDSSVSFSEELWELIQRITKSRPTHLHIHLQKGIQLILDSMKLNIGENGNPFTFEQLVERDSSLWENHVLHVENDPQLRAIRRPVLSSIGFSMIGIDLKVAAKGCPDDKIYKSSSYARTYMPRGNCIVEWKTKENKTFYFPFVRAYPKFTGHEDDGELSKDNGFSNDTISQFFVQPISSTKYVISTKKENGEAAHLAILKTSGGSYRYCTGSKNVHLIVSSMEEIEDAILCGNPSGSGYEGARSVAYGILNMLQRLEPKARELFCEFLAQTRLTASFELLCPDHQHVEFLDLHENTPVLFGFSFPSLQPLEGLEICLNPVFGFELAKELGIRTVSYEILPYTSDISDEFKKILGNFDEGRVHLYVDETCNIIGMHKFKTAWYVSLRAIREKTKGMVRKLTKENANPKHILSTTKEAIKKRFRAIQTFLDISKESIQAYTNLGLDFVDFIVQEKYTPIPLEGRKEQYNELIHQVTDLFPVLWKEFILSTEKNDRIPVI